MTLEPETSTSWTAGVVWSPMPELDFTLDWYDIEMRNQTQSLSVNKILQDEYDCRLGIDEDPGSKFCADTIARVVRSGADNHIASVHGDYGNTLMESTSGLHARANYRMKHMTVTLRVRSHYPTVTQHDDALRGQMSGRQL